MRSICIPVVTDSTSALGYLFKAWFELSREDYFGQVAWRLELDVLAVDSSLYGHHIKNPSIVIVDSLSRNFHVPADVLQLTFIQLRYSQVVSTSFRLAGSSFDIISWIRSLKPPETVKMVLPRKHKHSCLGAYLSKRSSWQASVSEISGWARSPNTSVLSWLGDSLRLLRKITLARKHSQKYSEDLQKAPSISLTFMFQKNRTKTQMIS